MMRTCKYCGEKYLVLEDETDERICEQCFLERENPEIPDETWDSDSGL